MMLFMRTTVTLEPDVARLLDDHARRTRKSFKETLNAAVRLGLGRISHFPPTQEFIIEARPMLLKAGLDGGRFNSLVDEMETDGFIEKARSEKPKEPLS